MSREQNIKARKHLGALINAGAIDRVGEVFADDDKVAIACTLAGTHQGDFLDVAATGRRVEVRGVQVGRFVDAMFVERWGSSDELGILKQLGATVTT